MEGGVAPGGLNAAQSSVALLHSCVSKAFFGGTELFLLERLGQISVAGVYK